MKVGRQIQRKTNRSCDREEEEEVLFHNRHHLGCVSLAQGQDNRKHIKKYNKDTSSQAPLCTLEAPAAPDRLGLAEPGPGFDTAPGPR